MATQSDLSVSDRASAIEFSDLETFVEVAQRGSFSRAAERLQLTQPAVSKRIQSLEAGLGARLFDRIGRQVDLTHAGRLLLPRARRLLRDRADARRLLENLSRAVAGELHLATSHHVGLHRLSPVLRAFSERYPDVQLDIRFEDSEAAHELVRRGISELAVVTLDPAGSRALETRVLWRDPLEFLVATDHPLAQAGSISLEQLSRYPAILPGLATYTGRIVAGLFAERNLVLRPTLSTNYLETIRMLVETGLGWSMLPARMAETGLSRLQTDARPVERVLGWVANPARTRSNAAAAFMKVLEEHAD